MPQRLFYVLARLGLPRRTFALLTVAALSTSATGAPSIEAFGTADQADAALPSLQTLTAADDRFLAWHDASPSAARPDFATPADATAVVASRDALTAAFDGENPIIPLPPALVAGLVGLIAVGGIALRRQQGAAGGTKMF